MKKTMTNILSTLMIFAVLATTAAGQEKKAEDLFGSSNGSLPAGAELRQGDIAVVSVNDALLSSGGAAGATLNLRFLDGAYQFQAIRTSLEQTTTGAFVWRGRVRDGGNALFTSHEGLVYGRIETNRGLFLLRPIRGTKKHRIVSMDSWLRFTSHEQDVMIPQLPAGRKAATSSFHEEETETAASKTPEADVLVLYNAGFREANGGAAGAVARINYLVALANQCYVNSKVNFSIRLVHTAEVDYPNDLTASTALSDLTERVNGLETVGDMRDKYGADFVVLIRSLSEEQKFAGLAWFMDESFRGAIALFQEFAYAVVGDGEYLGGDGYYYYAEETTLAHELGHIMGNDHDRANSSDLEPLKRNAHGYHLGGLYRTVMSYPQSALEKNIPYFSNPQVKYDGIPAGDAGDNCAQSMNSVAAKVVTWRPKRVADNGKDFLDVEAPYIINVKIAGSNGANVTGSANIEITLVAADNRDVAAYKIVERSSKDTAEWQDVKPAKRLKIRNLPFQLSDSHKHVRCIFIYVKDSAGNVSKRERLRVRYINENAS